LADERVRALLVGALFPYPHLFPSLVGAAHPDAYSGTGERFFALTDQCYTILMPARLLTWIFILLSLTVGAVLWWRLQGKNEGQAAETMNVTVPGPTSSILVGHWTLDGSDVVWGDTSTEIKDVSGYAKHGNFSNNLSTGSVTAGRIGQGIVFNGTSDSVSLGSVYNGVKTVAFWVKPNSTTQSLIDLNGTATIDMTSGIVAANSFTTPTIYIDGVVRTASGAPTLVDYQQSDWTSQTAGNEVTPTVTWQVGDLVLVFGSTEAGTSATLNTPTATGLSFSLVTSINTADSGDTAHYLWSATAGSNGSGAITATRGDAGTLARGIAAFVYRGSSGLGNTATLDNSANKTISLTRGYANSATAVVLGDWNAVNDTTVTSSPGSGTQRVAQFVTDAATFFLFDWGDQGAAGTTSYGITNHTGTVDMSGIAVEVRGYSSLFLDTNWHHVAVTTGTGINASAAYLGKIASSYFGGALDDIRFYSTELSATQVADLYKSSGAKEYISSGADDMMTDGLVGYWTFDGDDVKWSDTGTEIKDVSGNGNHGAASGLTASSVTPGKLGQGLQFNGTSDYVNIDGILSYTNGISQMSVSMWIFQSALAEGNALFVRRDVTSFWGFGTSDAWGGSDDICIILSDSDSENPSYTTENLHATNVWEHWIFVFDGTQTGNSNRLKVYKNGIQRTLTFFDIIPSTTLGYSGTPVANIGGYMDSASFSGKIDDVRIYDRALSTAEITNLYNMGR